MAQLQADVSTQDLIQAELEQLSAMRELLSIYEKQYEKAIENHKRAKEKIKVAYIQFWIIMTLEALAVIAFIYLYNHQELL